MSTQLIYSKEFNKHNTMGHPENASRLNTMISDFNNSKLTDLIDVIQPEILPEKSLLEIHSERMIQEIKEISSSGLSWIDLDTYVCKDDYETSRLAAGSLVQLCKNILDKKTDNGYALVRPPGHHATSTRSMGFCIFNNAAIAANEISKLGKKVLIFDPDVHHGNGTQEILYSISDVMYQSFHLSPHYPGTGAVEEIGIDEGEGYTVNAPLAHGNGDNAVCKILDDIFLPIAKQFKPDLIIFSNGYDSHHQDPLGGLKLTSNFYAEMIKKYQKIQPRIACTIEGGYNLGWIGKCFLSQLGALKDQDIKIKDDAEEKEDIKKVKKDLKDEMSKYWTI